MLNGGYQLFGGDPLGRCIQGDFALCITGVIMPLPIEFNNSPAFIEDKRVHSRDRIRTEAHLEEVELVFQEQA